VSRKKGTSFNTVVETILQEYPREPSSLISVLQDLQEDQHYLPEPALEHVAEALGIPRNQVYHVATFYKAFSLAPRGKHLISICRGTACHVKGASRIADMIKTELDIEEGETTRDNVFTVQSVRCLGCCSLAPAMMIDREVYGGVTPAKLRRILKHYTNNGS
jgi:NADH-quinone oxidoreductase subunit E